MKLFLLNPCNNPYTSKAYLHITHTIKFTTLLLKDILPIIMFATLLYLDIKPIFTVNLVFFLHPYKDNNYHNNHSRTFNNPNLQLPKPSKDARCTSPLLFAMLSMHLKL